MINCVSCTWMTHCMHLVKVPVLFHISNYIIGDLFFCDMTERCWLAVLHDLLEAQKIIRHQGPETDFWLKESQHPFLPKHHGACCRGKKTQILAFHWGTPFTLFALCHLKSTWTDATSLTSTWVTPIKTLCGCLIYGYVKIVISLMYFTFSSLSPMCWPRLAFPVCHIKVRELYHYSPKILVVRVPGRPACC